MSDSTDIENAFRILENWQGETPLTDTLDGTLAAMKNESPETYNDLATCGDWAIQSAFQWLVRFYTERDASTGKSLNDLLAP